MNPSLRAGLFSALFALPLVSLALTSDREQPIHIEADNVRIDDNQGISVYSGNVVYTQGTIRLQADTVRLYYTRDRKIDRMEAEGTPARFRQQLEGRDDEVRAEALHIEYHAEASRLILSREAHVWRLNSEFSGDVIDYDAANDHVSAAKGANDERRVQVIIQPAQKQQQGNTPPNGAKNPD